MAIEYTLKMVNTLKSIKNKFALTDEDVRLMLSEEYNNNSVQYVCGMSVPPNMMYHISKKIEKQWLNNGKG